MENFAASFAGSLAGEINNWFAHDHLPFEAVSGKKLFAKLGGNYVNVAVLKKEKPFNGILGIEIELIANPAEACSSSENFLAWFQGSGFRRGGLLQIISSQGKFQNNGIIKLMRSSKSGETPSSEFYYDFYKLDLGQGLGPQDIAGLASRLVWDDWEFDVRFRSLLSRIGLL